MVDDNKEKENEINKLKDDIESNNEAVGKKCIKIEELEKGLIESKDNVENLTEQKAAITKQFETKIFKLELMNSSFKEEVNARITSIENQEVQTNQERTLKDKNTKLKILESKLEETELKTK